MSSMIMWSSRWSRSTGCISTCGSPGWPTAVGCRVFFVAHRGYHHASTALMDPMTKAFVADIHGFVAARGLELIGFAKGQRKDDLAQEFLAKFGQDEGVLFVGRAQEKARVWHTQRRHNPSTGDSYAWLVRSSAFINFFYFYCVDADFGPFFLKFGTYFPYTAKLCINGNETDLVELALLGRGPLLHDQGVPEARLVDQGFQLHGVHLGA